MHLRKLFIISILFLSCLTGCLYKMPDENCISTLPNTNNPSLTREIAPSLIPGQS
ncbi:MAG: hypothetical protein KR126chlam2_01038 [Chlamydiae bacterium]|nr:hypothetical protein [Chlamydiota bacterium]